MQEVKLDFSYSLKDANFEMDALQQEMLNFYIRADPKFRMAFYQDFTQQFFQYIKDKARLREPVYLSITGAVRGGKSYCAISLSWIMNYLQGRIMDMRYITANNIEYLETIKDMSEEDLKNSTFVQDEQRDYYGVGSVAKRTKMQDVQNIIAKFNISNISICPTKITENSHYALKIFGRDFKQGVNRFMLYNLQAGEGSSHRPLSMIYLPIFTKLLPKEIHVPLEEAYNKKKDEWILRETRGEGNALMTIKKRTAEIISKDQKYLSIKKKDERLAFLSMKLGNEWTSGEVKEVFNLINLILAGNMPDES